MNENECEESVFNTKYPVPMGVVPRINNSDKILGNRFQPNQQKPLLTLTDDDINFQFRPTTNKIPEPSNINVDQDVKTNHSHYFKSVKHLEEIDVYRVLDLFEVTDPCIQHAIKKLLVAGGRGAGKGFDKDIQEAIDSLKRLQVMRSEDYTHV